MTENCDKTVLIVDDDPAVLTYLENVLTSAGYDCEATVSPEVAQARLVGSPPDIGVIDVNLPGMSGLDLIRIARESGAATHFLLITGGIDDSQKEEIDALDSVGFLHKPLRRHDLLFALELIHQP